MAGRSTASMPLASTPGAGRPAATQAGSPPRSSSAESLPRRSLADRLQISAATLVAGQRRRADLRDAQPPGFLFDLVADPGRLAFALAQLVAGRLRDKQQVSVLSQ